MQHRTGWLLLAGVPPVLVLLAGLFGTVIHDADEAAPAFALMAAGVYAVAMSALAWTVTGLQASGLARRDVQDRSIEFWRSLPVGDAQALSATLLAHGLLVPLALTLVALACSLPLGLLIVAKGYGVAALASLPWGLYGQVGLAALPRFGLGAVLASLWAAPMVLLTMVASAWLKRWGLPVLVVALGAGGAILDRAYGLPQVFSAVVGLFDNFGAALVPLVNGGVDNARLDTLPALLMQDLWARVQDLASPLFVLALAVSAGCFALLVWHRQRG
jgi:ABC-2 type transport system permease protein